MEVSAKENDDNCVNKGFMEIITQIKRDMVGEKAEINRKNTNLRNKTITLVQKKQNNQNKKYKCCQNVF